MARGFAGRSCTLDDMCEKCAQDRFNALLGTHKSGYGKEMKKLGIRFGLNFAKHL